MSKVKYRTHFYESFKELLKQRSLELLDDYQTYLTTKIFHYRCLNCGKTWESTNHDAYHIKACSCCRNILESQVANYIKQLLPNELIQNNVKQLLEKGRCEIDIYIPSLKAGIEVDGTHYHSERSRGKLAQQEKSLMCIKAGISLIHVYEQMWNEDQESIKTKIKQFIQDVKDRKESTSNTLNLDCFVCPDNPIIESVNEPTIIVESGRDIVYNAGTVILRRQ